MSHAEKRQLAWKEQTPSQVGESIAFLSGREEPTLELVGLLNKK